ncbi:hypothetical protein F2Q68_00032843 [Brassica cretica]|uniref:ABC transmembrane type-1 domain-containing protein n=1 Tax=Brassica cretica TaxID=69181 RepID=A0A8S9G7T4_BRACR|nr:hypothetical protein F2Q68_00032843 [Brassica cretica]
MATELFTQMHLRVFRASMSFFDVTPMGRILNRVNQSVVDLRLPGQFAYVAVAAINILGIMGVMIQVAWQVLIIFIPVVAASSWYRQYYISAARELARLAGISRSPLVHHFSETLSGVTTIRSFDQEPRFLSDIMKLSDCLSRLTFHSTGATEWLCFRLELLSTITFALSLVIVVSAPEGTVNPSFAGLAITYALNLNNLQSNLVWTLCELENKMISVERMLQYIDIPSEPSLVIESTRPEKSWPSRGEITISNLQVRYGPHLPMVLHGLTCTFPGGLKTGIVGRTGCGKSTLIQTLFRIVEPTAGEIRIDGIDILTIGLHDLRSRLSIIPQDPTMFEGTVRSNLDPLEEYSDDQIWEALDKCQLGVEVRKKELKLDSPVSENGQNWSVGQRQLSKRRANDATMRQLSPHQQHFQFCVEAPPEFKAAAALKQCGLGYATAKRGVRETDAYLIARDCDKAAYDVSMTVEAPSVSCLVSLMTLEFNMPSSYHTDLRRFTWR